MKKLHILSLMALMLVTAFATPVFAESKKDSTLSQTSMKRYYLTLTQTERIQGAKNTGAIIGLSNDFASKAQLSEADVRNIKRYRFPTLLDGANYLAPYGWILDQTYTTTMPGQGTSVVWVLHKDVVKDLELCEGLTVEE